MITRRSRSQTAPHRPDILTPVGPILTPILDFIEDFVVAFVDALDQITPVKSHFAGVIGGSLGGNLGLILGRRPLAANPWLNASIVSWSPASVWPPKVKLTKLGPQALPGTVVLPEETDYRIMYFREVYDKNITFVGLTQPGVVVPGG